MTTASSVPVTRGEELEGDEAFETLRRTGRRRLAVDAVDRFRAADGFSHSRALAFQITLTLLPAQIAVVGLAAALDQDAFRDVVQSTIDEIAPGAVGDILTAALRQGTGAAREESGEVALAGGGVAAAVAGTIGILLWAFLTSLALFFGLAFAAQLEAARAGVRRPRTGREENVEDA